MRLEESNVSELSDEATKSLAGVKTGLYSRTPISAEVTCLPTARHPLLRQRELKPGPLRERENLFAARISK